MLHRSLHSCDGLTLPSPWPAGPLLLLPLSHYRMLSAPAGRLRLQDCLLTLVRLLLPMSSHVPITVCDSQMVRTPHGVQVCFVLEHSHGHCQAAAALPKQGFAWGATDCPLSRAAFCVCLGPGMCVTCVAQANLRMSGTCCWSALPCLTFEPNFQS